MKKIKYLFFGLAATAMFTSSCSKDDEVIDCSSDIVASYNGTLDCRSAGQSNRIVTINSTGTPNNIQIVNVLYRSGYVTTLNATIDCASKTITIPKQMVSTEPYDTSFLSGSGSYTANSVTVEYAISHPTGQVYYACSGTFLR